jgi:hypothetical protein
MFWTKQSLGYILLHFIANLSSRPAQAPPRELN